MREFFEEKASSESRGQGKKIRRDQELGREKKRREEERELGRQLRSNEGWKKGQWEGFQSICQYFGGSIGEFFVKGKNGKY